MLENSSMITVEAPRGTAPILSCTLRLDRPTHEMAAAHLRATAHGVFEVRIDGRPVADDVLAPGWSTYEARLPVMEVDITSLLGSSNEIEVLLGNGWWRGGLGFGGIDVDYGPATGFVGEIEVVWRDGCTQLLVTDDTWSARRSDVVENDLYDGQEIDARLRHVHDALAVRSIDFDRAALVPRSKPPIVRHESVRPVRTWRSPAGRLLVDFGQNLVGWTRLRTRGSGGTTVRLRHAEVLENGELATRPLRGARATDTFVLSGGDDVFEPTLTFHGFRYVEIEGLTADLGPDDLEAVVVHSDMARTGSFECSSALVNRLVQNSVWGQRGNFLDVPTDCPQRDERLGWTGDIAVFAPTAAYQYDVAEVLHGWLLDLHAEAQHHGYVPLTVPDVLKLARGEARERFAAFAGPMAIWSDAAVWVPEALWRAYGDRGRLGEHYPGIVAHLDSVEPLLSETGLWDRGVQLGDWLDPTAPADDPMAARADPGVVATACLFRSAAFAARAATVLDRPHDAVRWSRLAWRLRSAFREHHVHDGGARITSDAPTVYALAIHFGLLDDEERVAAADRLARLTAENDYQVATGFAGTPYVSWALSETGHVEEAYRLLLEEQCPSFLYPVTMGATTVWERWDSMLPDGSVNPGEMTSFNHYAFGAICDWLYQVVAGIRCEAPGYSRLTLRPVPGPGLDWARGSLDTPRGRVSCGWRRHGDHIEVTATVPDGLEADLEMPDRSHHLLGGGVHVLRYRPASTVT